MNIQKAKKILRIKSDESIDGQALAAAYGTATDVTARRLCLADFLTDYERIELLCSVMVFDDLKEAVGKAIATLLRYCLFLHPMARWALQAQSELEGGDIRSGVRALCRAYDALGEDAGGRFIEEELR